MKFKVFPASAAYDSIKQSNADQRAHEYNDRQEGGVRNGILDLYVSDGFTDTDIVTGAISLVVFLFLYGKGEDTVGTVGGVLCFIQMIPLIGVVAPTEKALHKAFDKDGKKCLSQKRKET